MAQTMVSDRREIRCLEQGVKKGVMMRSETENSNQEYITTDINLTSFLRCRKFPIVRIKREGDTRVLFLFCDTPELREAIVAYANDGDVPVRSFSNTLRDLKALVR